MLMASRLLYGMAKQNVLPPVFGKVMAGRRSPWVSIIFTTLIAFALIVFVSTVLPESVTASLGGTTSLLLLTVFAVVNVAVIILRQDKSANTEHFKAPKFLPWIGVFTCVFLVGPWARLDDLIQYQIAAALVGIGVVLLIAAGAVGVLSRKRIAVGYTALALLGATGAAAALGRPAADWTWALPSVVGAACGALVLRLLYRRPRTAGEGPAPGRVVDRRGVLIALTGAGLAGALGWRLGGTGEVDAARDAVRLPAPASAGPEGSGLDVDGLTSYLTPNADFYRVDTALVVPRVDAGSWRLKVHGEGVRRPLELDFEQLLRRDTIERDITLTCVSNEVGGPYVSSARWLGVPLAPLLEEAGVRPPSRGGPADQLVSRSVDGMTLGTPVDTVMDGRDAMLAIGMNGEPLPFRHGFPVRMVVPGLYGYVSACKWLQELELTTFDAFDPYWVRRDWAREAPIKTQSRIDTPRPFARLRAGTVRVAGVAWAQHRGIRRVEIRVDDGPWQDARLAAEAGLDTWRQWVWDWPATGGSHTLHVRATDATGAVQTSRRQGTVPDGATGLHSVVVSVD